MSEKKEELAGGLALALMAIDRPFEVKFLGDGTYTLHGEFWSIEEPVAALSGEYAGNDDKLLLRLALGVVRTRDESVSKIKNTLPLREWKGKA